MSVPMELAAILVGLLVVLVIATDLTVSFEDDRTLEAAATTAARHLTSSGASDCTVDSDAALGDGARRTICRVHAAVGEHIDARVRVARQGDRVVVCAMTPVRSVTGALSAFAGGRVHLVVATSRTRASGDGDPGGSEDPLRGHDWRFCPA
jgi:hypothetical protein